MNRNNLGLIRRRQRTRNKIMVQKFRNVFLYNRFRLYVFKSNYNLYACISGENGATLLSVSTLSRDFVKKIENPGNKYRCNKINASLIGSLLAEKALERGINFIVFDRSGYSYHGVVAALAEGARKGGLSF